MFQTIVSKHRVYGKNSRHDFITVEGSEEYEKFPNETHFPVWFVRAILIVGLHRARRGSPNFQNAGFPHTDISRREFVFVQYFEVLSSSQISIYNIEKSLN